LARLKRSSRRLIWLNPLLRFYGFEARARGMRAMLPLVDEFRPVHNLEALADLCAALDRSADGDFGPRRWIEGGRGGAARSAKGDTTWKALPISTKAAIR
jgi:hypothetical protein